MFDVQMLLTFGGTALVMTMVPGLDTAMVLRTSALQTPRHGAFVALGIGLGCLCWGSAVALGLQALVASSSRAFALLKFAGAAYLLWLGAKALFTRSKMPIALVPSAPQLERLAYRAAFRRGLVTNLLNPKVGVFYLTLLPHFVPADAPTGAYSFLLTCVHVILAVLWFGILSGATFLIRGWLERPKVMRRIDRATGCLFLGFGAHLALA